MLLNDMASVLTVGRRGQKGSPSETSSVRGFQSFLPQIAGVIRSSHCSSSRKPKVLIMVLSFGANQEMETQKDGLRIKYVEAQSVGKVCMNRTEVNENHGP